MAGAVAAALVLTVVLIVRLTGEDAPRPAVGDFLAEDSPYRLVDVETIDRELELPSGIVRFNLLPPVEALDESEFDDEPGLTADGDGVFVGIDWDATFYNDLVVAAAAEDGELAILISDQRYPLGPLVNTGPRLPERSGFLVAPAGTELDDVILEVRFDGRIQTINAGTGVRDTTAAELSVADELAVEGTDDVCPEAIGESTPDLATSTSCSYGRVTLVPYVPGLGWAEEGQLWVTMDGYLSIDIEQRTADAEVADYRTTGGALTFALDGSAPARVSQTYEFGTLTFESSSPSRSTNARSP